MDNKNNTVEQVEIWKPVKGYEGEYEVSCLGRVRTISRMVPRKHRGLYPVKSKVKKAHKGNNGYWTIALVHNNITKNTLLHRIIALSFIDNPKGHRCINHKDGNKSNNSLSNLEWCTHKENNKHALDTGLRSKRRDMDKHIFKQIRTLKAEGKNISQISIITGQTKSRVQGITSGRTYKDYELLTDNNRFIKV